MAAADETAISGVNARRQAKPNCDEGKKCSELGPVLIAQSFADLLVVDAGNPANRGEDLMAASR